MSLIPAITSPPVARARAAADVPVRPSVERPAVSQPGFEPASAPVLQAQPGGQVLDGKAAARAVFDAWKVAAPGAMQVPGVVGAPPPVPGQRLLICNKGPQPGLEGESSIMLLDLGTGKVLKK